MQINVIQANKAEEVVWQHVEDIFMRAFVKAYNNVDARDLQNLFELDRKNTETLNFDFILAKQNQEILGYILSCYSSQDKRVYVLHLAVDPSKHCKGVGKALIKACEDFYKEADFVALSTGKDNQNALGFYNHIGFYETGYVPEIAVIFRPNNDPQRVNLEKIIQRN